MGQSPSSNRNRTRIAPTNLGGGRRATIIDLARCFIGSPAEPRPVFSTPASLTGRHVRYFRIHGVAAPH